MGRPGSQVRYRVHVMDDGNERSLSDRLATEEPLEIRIDTGDRPQRVGVTMRTPGNDFELAAGFLFSEGIVEGAAPIRTISYCTDREIAEDERLNIVTVSLAASVPGEAILERHFMVNSACGICGRETVADLFKRGCKPPSPGPELAPEFLYSLPSRVRDEQRIFETTGGLHAAALFDPGGDLIALREDIGRHNAVDKLIGWALLKDGVPLDETVLLVSGRAGFEIVQKAIAAGIPVVAAISAPSSLAVDLAQRFGTTLVGFLRDRRFNIYSGRDRILAVAD